MPGCATHLSKTEGQPFNEISDSISFLHLCAPTTESNKTVFLAMSKGANARI